MKKFIITFLSIGLGCPLFAQTTALDFTRNDCNGNSHHLFAELNAGQVVILEYVMMNCTPCVTAGNGLKSLLTPYETSHPGKVKIYGIGYDDAYTTQQLNDWKSSNNLSSHTVFTDGGTEVNYYGGMGMPTIVVVGGPYHKVFYKKQGYAPSDNANIQGAIDNALVASGTNPITPEALVSLYPNPTDKKLNIKLDKQITLIEISDLNGKSIFNKNVRGLEATSIDAAQWANGTYIVTFFSNSNSILTRKLIIQH